ncbi:hypothetical protein KLP40_15450 [Hymenobacter sp. NST-14]|uniref:hypothetical protein n=1 Tax=Hymenobacter piscis TaxID=2839984 RepID=UPI001C032F39|nr:hypothetical protein [Hymenobacter piscis]MBT9394566.1 hypothetical protein [Hymenobacter piscis]
MSASSPLASLYPVLQAARLNAQANAHLLRRNEAATRAALIDPVLRALGWDTANVQVVEPEKTLGGDLRVDYLLRDAAGQPRLVIEAKCLDASLDKHGYVSKILGYALGFKVQTVFITDGLHWHCYSNLHQGNTEAVTFSLTDDMLPAALHLIQWLDAAHSGHGITSPPPISPEAPPTVAPVAAAPASPIKTSSSSSFTELAQIHPSSSGPNEKPKLLRLPDGSVVAIKTWKDILVKTSLYVLGQQPNTSIPYPDKAGKKKFLLDWQKPAAGIGYVATVLQGRPLFIYTNYSAPDCVANALHVLKILPGSAAVAVAF